MRILLEDFTNSGAGLRWQAHQDYYRETGLDVFFRQEVPYNITSNPCYAEQVAKLCIAQHEQKPTLQLLELGGGNGIFAHNFLKALEALSPLLFQNLHYVLSDFSEPMLNTLSEHPAFRDWQDRGHLEFRVIDASGQTPIHENWDGIIANYLFSTFPTDIICKPGAEWCIEKTRLMPSLQTEWLDFIANYLCTRDLSAPLPTTHTHYERFAQLFLAQQAIAKTLHAQRDTLTMDSTATEHELWSWLETALLKHWLDPDQVQNDATQTPDSEALQQTHRAFIQQLLIAPLRAALAPQLWQTVLAAKHPQGRQRH